MTLDEIMEELQAIRKERDALRERLREASLLIGEATTETDAIVAQKDVPYADTVANWNKAKARGYRGKKFNLGDARLHADRAGRKIRQAWDILDPGITPFKG